MKFPRQRLLKKPTVDLTTGIGINVSKMVKLSAKYVIRRNKANRSFLIRKKGDSDKQFLSKITHLPLNNQFIDQIVKCFLENFFIDTFADGELKMNDCENVKVLYLQNNLLRNIENMENFPTLTHLYLQRNFIVKIENLKPLTNLKKIYLGRNEIQVLEGMEDLRNVREVHIEHQDIPPGGTMYFEPLTVLNLGETLHVLNVSQNYLTSIKCLANLSNLRILTANDNLLSDIDDVTTTITDWPFLQKLSLVGNEVTRRRWYRDSIIFASQSLEILDSEPIHSNTRIFIQKLVQQKRMAYMKQKSRAEESGKREKRKSLKFADEPETKENRFDFTDSFPPPKPVYLYPAWKLRANVNPVNQKTLLPRPYWKKKTVTQQISQN